MNALRVEYLEKALKFLTDAEEIIFLLTFASQRNYFSADVKSDA